MKVSDKLKELRKEKGLTQKEIAKLLNLSETGYASYEQGLSEPSIDNIKKICQMYKITADELLGLEN